MNEAFERLPEAGKMAVLAVIALVFAGALLWAVGAAGRRRARQLDALARALGMERVVPGQPGHRPDWVELRRAGPGPRASVVFRGGVRDASGQRDEWTELETQLKPPLGVGLALRRDDALTQLGGWFEGEDLRAVLEAQARVARALGRGA
jgi:hypothetical protein